MRNNRPKEMPSRPQVATLRSVLGDEESPPGWARFFVSPSLCSGLRLRMTAFCWGILLLVLLGVCAAGCQTSKRVVLRVDGQEHVIETSAATVRDVLREAGVSLGEWDRVEPGLWAEIPRSATITVIRVQERTKREPIPFTRQVVKDEALPEGRMRLLQAGRAGTTEFTYRVSLDGSEEIDRQLVAQRTITDARPEIVAVGSSSKLAAVPITGTMAYVANGNAWILRRSSAEKRPVTFSGDLDGRVFDLSENGQYLLFTRMAASPSVSSTQTLPPFNELWVLDTRILQEGPKPLGVTNVVYAEWAADGRSMAYSTAESVQGSPGWKARNDLWMMSFQGLTKTQILPPSSSGVYSWWGTEYAWNPDKKCFAYATADTIGTIDATTGLRSPLLQFPVFHTYGEWVWVPKVSWSPEGRYLACVAHNVAPGGKAEDSPLFDLWILDTQGDARTRLVERVGMWAAPTWSAPWRDKYDMSHVDIAYGVAQLSSYSQYSPYNLYVMDRDGSNKTQLLPPQGQSGLGNLDVAWAPSGRQLICVWQGDIYLVAPDSLRYWPLTSGIICEKLEWEGQ